MPEGLELGTLADSGSLFVRDTTTEQRLLQDIRIDATKKEAQKLRQGHPARKGMIFSICSSEAYFFLRFGSQPGAQTPENDSDEEYDDENPDVEDVATLGLPSTPYPPQYRTQGVDVPISTHRLLLRAFHPSHRNVILEFADAKGQELWLQVQTLTHTTMTIYKRERWERSVGKVSKDVRGHKVVLALVFRDYVVVFTTLDMVTKIFWASARGDLPDQLPVLHLPNGLRTWMEEVVWWMRFRHAQETHQVTVNKIKEGKFPWIKTADIPAWIAIGEKIKKSGLPPHRHALGVWVIRKSGIFPGIGVYSAPEVFHGGGLLVDLREADIFDSASRTGRLCAAVYSFLIGNKERVLMVQARTQDFTLAVSTEHRKQFGDRFLSVWARDRTTMSQRQKRLIQDRKARVLITDEEATQLQDVHRLLKRDFVPEQQVPDPFEPDCIRFALEQEGVNLGGLIFGEEHWSALSTAAGLPDGCRVFDNPLAQYFDELTDEWPGEKDGLLSYWFKKPEKYERPPFEAIKRYLDLSSYSDNSLFSPQGMSKNAWVETEVYRENWLPKTRRNPGSDIWTAFPLHEPPLMDQIHLRLHDKQTKSKRLSLYIIMCTNGWSVGAFDFCGVPRLISTAAEKRMLAYCWEDPTLTLFYQIRLHYENVTRLLDERQHKLGLEKVAEDLIKKKKAAESEERKKEAKAKKLGMKYEKPVREKNSNDHSIIEGYKAFQNLQERLWRQNQKRKRLEEKQKQLELAQHPNDTRPSQSGQGAAACDEPLPKKRRTRGDKATLKDAEALLVRLGVSVTRDGGRRQTRLG